jgi:hypothetical protein
VVFLLAGKSLPSPSWFGNVSCTNLKQSPHDAAQRGYSAGCTTRDEKPNHGRQIVRRRKWWRRDKKLYAKSIPSDLRLHKLKFFQSKLQGCCFNCFARDHTRVNCREPTKCRRCKRQGHTSTLCPRAHFSHACKPFAQAAFSSTKPSRSHSEASAMEHCRLIGSASTGLDVVGYRGAGERGQS